MHSCSIGREIYFGEQCNVALTLDSRSHLEPECKVETVSEFWKRRFVHISAQRESYSGTVLGHQV